MIEVFFEVPGKHAEHVATFHCEQIYNDMVPALEKCAKKHGFTALTERLTDG